MRISAKGRYAVATVIYLAEKQEECQLITAVRVANDLGISKLYLEQIFSILKKSKILLSVKGSLGGYKLAKSDEDISVYEILYSTETGLFEETEQTLSQDGAYIDKALKDTVWTMLDNETEKLLKRISIRDILKKTVDKVEPANMYYI